VVPVEKVVSASLGSSARDHSVEVCLAGRRFLVSRQGTDGDKEALETLLRDLSADPDVAAIGLGGTDLFLNAAGRTYWLHEMKPLARLVSGKALVDGSGLKGAVEGDTVRYMHEELGLTLANKKVLVTSAVDRWGIAMALVDAGAQVSFGDLLYILGIPKTLHSVPVLRRVVRAAAPFVIRMPFSWLYPSESDHTSEPKRSRLTDTLYREADIIVGDYKFVTKYMPDGLQGTWVVTNTTTEKDLDFLRSRGVGKVITTTPRMEGRSFGTNVMEALLIASVDARAALSADQYLKLIARYQLYPGVVDL
jgi:hypothetical protein